MHEPILFGLPISTLFLYFIFYSFAGWSMETVYCSVREKRLVPRGFLLGPICPIYGIGALLMVLFFSHLSNNPPLFYIMATVMMSAWEYFVGWLLETTTHMKYWDYSSHKFNIKGRISLSNCLWWGLLAYLTVFHIHPWVEYILAQIPLGLRYSLAGSMGMLLVVDTVTTIRKLALTAKVMARLEAVSSELRVQAALGKAEFSERLEAVVDNISPELRERLGEARVNVSKNLDEALDRLHVSRMELIEQAERHSRRFRSRYSNITSKRFALYLPDVKAAGERLKAAVQKAKNGR